jgi:hypothetical protein
MECTSRLSPMMNFGIVSAEPLDSATIMSAFEIIQCTKTRQSKTIKHCKKIHILEQ